MMRPTTLPGSRDFAEAAERQMRKWVLRLEAERQREEQAAPQPVPQLIHPYLAISRETGVDAGEIAGSVAAACGWKLLDRELVDYIAEHYQLSRLALDYVDERTASWFHDTFGKWLDDQLVSQAEYVSRLAHLTLLAAQHESTIFVGRGVQFILPRVLGVTVRLIAPLAQRVQRIIARRQCSQQEAERFIHETDKGRADFVRRYFHRDVADPHLYDLVINLEHTPRDTAAELIVSLQKWRFA